MCKLAALLVLAALAAAQSDGLEIHIFDVGQAASELLVFPSGYSVLIDAGELSWNSHKNSDKVAEQVETILGSKKVDVAVLSHMHLDHVGYTENGGFWNLLENKGFTFGKFVDRDGGVWHDKNGDTECTADEIEWHNIGVMSNTFTRWICYATNPVNKKIYGVRETAQLCSTSQIAPPDKLASVTITTVDGSNTTRKDGTPVSGDHSKDTLPPNENDFSVGLLVRYGKFAYSTAGDLDGQYYSVQQQGYEYNDEESVVGPRVGEVDVYHVNHHGSGHSSNAKWLSILKPQASIASLGTNNSYGHPDQDTLDRLLNAGDVYLTEFGAPDREYGNTVFANGHITIKVSKDGSSFSINYGNAAKQYKSKNVKSPVCTY